MVTHRPILATGEIYHVFNRSIGRENIFTSLRNLTKIIDIIDFYRYHQTIRFSKFLKLPSHNQEEYLLKQKKSIPLIEIFSFSFMPSHFHLLLRQQKDKGISLFLSNIQNSFAKFYNLKYNRIGGLFQSSFKAKRIQTSKQCIHVSRYIHLNHVTSNLITFDQLKTYPYASFYWYLNEKINRFVSTSFLLNYFKSINKFIRFTESQTNYQQKLKRIEKLLLE